MPGAVGPTGFTPFGYLRNPGHRAASWSAVEGGNLRTAIDWLGVEWLYPLQRNPDARFGIAVEDGACRKRAEFDAIGLTSRYHSALVMGFDWQRDRLSVAARFFLVDDDVLCARVQVTNIGLGPRQAEVKLVPIQEGTSPLPHALAVFNETTTLAPGATTVLIAVLARGATEAEAQQRAHNALRSCDSRYEAALAEDATFYAACPDLGGDWPSGWREGFRYDIDTTRLLIQPAAGIFDDVWPSWMVAWPRVVLAEGALDMLRLAFADPSLAQRAVLSMFRSAPQPNVPCVFEDGSYNMLAADGSRCGTSPAWCLPFLNLELLYLRSIDRNWLGALYPYLTAYLDWWLTERVDPDGWVVYKCTWESGEDGNPRLDPSGSGDAVIDRRVRPVELQGTMAHAAGVLTFFAAELDLADEVQRWASVESAYRERTRQLFDPDTGRYRDWLVDEQQFQPSRPDRLYWGVDTGRYSPLGLTPLLLGEPLPADEIWRHACPPWTMWPSWTYALVESAAAAGHFEQVGVLTAEIIERVYRVTTRRDLGKVGPLPGVAPEFWPEDWRTYQGHDAYGWGATTANLLIRHVFGFKESRSTAGWTVELCPALRPAFLEPGRRYAIHHLNYRGLVFDLAYVVESDGLRAELDLGELALACQVRELGPSGAHVYASDGTATRHAFALRMGAAFRLDLS